MLSNRLLFIVLLLSPVFSAHAVQITSPFQACEKPLITKAALIGMIELGLSPKQIVKIIEEKKRSCADAQNKAERLALRSFFTVLKRGLDDGQLSLVLNHDSGDDDQGFGRELSFGVRVEGAVEQDDGIIELFNHIEILVIVIPVGPLFLVAVALEIGGHVVFDAIEFRQALPANPLDMIRENLAPAAHQPPMVLGIGLGGNQGVVMPELQVHELNGLFPAAAIVPVDNVPNCFAN